jgi:hypothetical protein
VTEQLDRAVREQRRRNRVGEDACCETCGDSTLTHLVKVIGLVLCQCCLAVARGRNVLEVHHIAGGHEGPTLLVCANCHTELSELQRAWPSGLSFAERLERGTRDVAQLQVRKVAENG